MITITTLPQTIAPVIPPRSFRTDCPSSTPRIFAGMWTCWTSVRNLEEGETTNDLFAFLTTEPNAVVAPIHAKAMPVILTRPDEIETWDRSGAPSTNVFSSGDAAQVGIFVYGYTSGWLPASLLMAEGLPKVNIPRQNRGL